jgi:hypothetical protein
MHCTRPATDPPGDSLSTLLRLPLALLTALAMLLLWSAPAGAEEDPAVPDLGDAICAAGSELPECEDEPQPQAPADPVAEPEPEPEPEGEQTPPTPSEEDVPPADATTEDAAGTVPGGALVAPLAPLTGETPDGAGEDTDGASPSQTPPTTPPDVQETLECLAAVGEEFGTELVALLEEAVGGLVLQIGDELLEIDTPAELIAFLESEQGLRDLLEGLGEETVLQIITEGQELLEMSAEKFLACLPMPAEGEEPPPVAPAQPVIQPVKHEVSYANCDDARAKGAAPVHAGQPGYGAHLDSDSDGVGCEQDVQAAPVGPGTSTGGKLAYTGFEVWPFAGAGAVLVLLGSTLVAAARRRS